MTLAEAPDLSARTRSRASSIINAFAHRTLFYSILNAIPPKKR